MQWEFHGMEQDVDQEEEQGGQHVNGEEKLPEQPYDHYLHVYIYLPRGVGYPWYKHDYQGYRNH